MAKSKCNCKGCNNKAVELNKLVTRDTSGHKGVYNICDECLCRINKILDGDNIINDLDVKNVKSDKPKRKTAVQVIEEFGIDRLRDEYVNKGRRTKELAEELGVSVASLAQHLNRLGITKRGAKKREGSTSSDSKEGN